MKETYSASKRGSKWCAGSQLEKIASCIPILFQGSIHRYSIILKLVMLLKGALKCQQTGNISQMRNDAKISTEEGGGREWWALWHKTCFSMLHWTLRVPKAELKGMWQLLIGYRNSQEKNAPLGVRDMHLICRTWHEGNSGSKWRRKAKRMSVTAS